jgi:hypothetical protein
MLGLKSRKLVSPKHKGGGDMTKVYVKVSRHEQEK